MAICGYISNLAIILLCLHVFIYLAECTKGESSDRDANRKAVGSPRLPDEVIKRSAKDVPDKTANNYIFPMFPVRPSPSCRLRLSSSLEQFSKQVKTYEMIRISVKLNFGSNVSLVDSRNSSILTYDTWTWFYYGDDGSQQYLYWPIEVLVWSLGLLSISARIRQVPLTMVSNEQCPTHLNLTAGTNTTNDLIGQALADMTNNTIDFGKESETFQKFYWCYTERVEKLGPVWDSVCNNVICPYTMTQYVCCPYYAKQMRQAGSLGECHRRVYKNRTEWWSVPCLIGLVLFLYSPFLFLLFATSMVKRYPEDKTDSVIQQLSCVENADAIGSVVSNMESEVLGNNIENSVSILGDSGEEFVAEHSNPVTVCGTLLAPVKHMCTLDRVTLSRLVRLLFPLLSLSVIFLEVIIDNVFLKEYVQSCLEKGVPLGFRTLSAGFTESKQSKFLSFIGGPYLAIMFYIGFSWISLVPHRDCGECFSCGIHDYTKARSPLFIPIAVKETLGSVDISKKHGYAKIWSYHKANIFMIMNVDYWHLSFLILKARCGYLWSTSSFLFHPAIGIIVMLVPFILLIAVWIVEIVLATLIYGCPIVGHGFILTNGMSRVFKRLTRHRKSLIYTCLNYAFSFCYSVMFLFAYFLFCLIFLESFLFLSRVALFTYAGIIRYPKDSYGYIIVGCLTMYYLKESVQGFGRTYSSLLKTTIKVVKRLSKEDKQSLSTRKTIHGFSIPKEYFEYVISHTKPRRVHLFLTFLKGFFSVGMVSLSVALVKYFNKYRELSVVIQVITILLVGALPLVFRSLCSRKGEERLRLNRLRSDINRLTKRYIQLKKKDLNTTTNANDLFREFGISIGNGYQALS